MSQAIRGATAQSTGCDRGARGSRPSWTGCGSGCAPWGSAMTRSPPRRGAATRCACARRPAGLGLDAGPGGGAVQRARRERGDRPRGPGGPDRPAPVRGRAVAEQRAQAVGVRTVPAGTGVRERRAVPTGPGDHESLPQEDRLVLLRGCHPRCPAAGRPSTWSRSPTPPSARSGPAAAARAPTSGCPRITGAASGGACGASRARQELAYAGTRPARQRCRRRGGGSHAGHGLPAREGKQGQTA